MVRSFVTSGFHFIIIWKRLFSRSGKPGKLRELILQICKHPMMVVVMVMVMVTVMVTVMVMVCRRG